MYKKSNEPSCQEIKEIVGKYVEKDGPGVLFVSFAQHLHLDASYDLSGTKDLNTSIEKYEKLNLLLVFRQQNPLSPVRSSHLFHGHWVDGEFEAQTVSEKVDNETKTQVLLCNFVQ